MAQSNYNLTNTNAATARSKINEVFTAAATTNSGSSAPSTTFANMLWYDSSNKILKMRSEANDSWLDIMYINQSTGKAGPLNNTPVYNNSGVEQGQLRNQSNNAWKNGTSTTESLVSPAKVAAAIEEQVTTIGKGQTWSNVTLAHNFPYQNTSGGPIQLQGNFVRYSASTVVFQVSPDGSSWTTVATNFGTTQLVSVSIIIPDQYYYKITSSIPDDSLFAILS